MSEHQMLMVNLDELVNADHQYRKFKSLFNFKAVEAELLAVECKANYKGYGIERLFKCLLLQFMEDLSDRELERYLADSTAAKWFCDFALTEKIPDYSVFSKMRKKIGTNVLSKIFTKFRDQLRVQDYMGDYLCRCFSFNLKS
ncbi:transposase [Rickettsia rhipicephali]|uniref:transposase n=1 Tax=Rickettsia rhipicephali TaxID=33992 RepID=UPI00224D3549|nr:transposase [Rickettsia rhipicephali]MCX4080057.1 transposase [Rickettsia rhipicephali]